MRSLSEFLNTSVLLYSLEKHSDPQTLNIFMIATTQLMIGSRKVQVCCNSCLLIGGNKQRTRICVEQRLCDQDCILCDIIKKLDTFWFRIKFSILNFSCDCKKVVILLSSLERLEIIAALNTSLEICLFSEILTFFKLRG